MEAVTDPSVESVCLMWPSQVAGKTELLLNILGYHIHHHPSPMLVLQPTIEMGRAFSTDRLATMLRDCPAIRGKVRDAKSRDSSNTILHKQFPGGHVTIVGANAPTGLASRPIRVVLCDEVDRYPLSAGNEGDPISLAVKRTETFWDAVLVYTSTPTVKGASRIEKEFEASDKRYWFVPCPKCGEFQRLMWGQVRWQNDTTAAWYECGHCQAHWTDAERVEAIWLGEWRPTAPFRGKRGYHLNGVYSVLRAKKGKETRLHQMADEFLDAHSKGEETQKAWVNTFLAETWEPPSEKVDTARLTERCEEYGAEVPDGVLLLVAGVDVQHQRLEGEIVGCGLDGETWGIEVARIYGSTDSDDVWRQLDDWLLKPRRFADGTPLHVVCACIDSGARTKSVYAFTKPREQRRVYAVKGSSIEGAPLVSSARKSSVQGVKLYQVGTITAKDTILTRLQVRRPGPRYCHFPIGRGYDDEYFAQLGAERVETRLVRGFQKRVYVKQRERNEALDYRAYALAAVDILNPDWDAIAKSVEVQAEKVKSLANADIKKTNAGKAAGPPRRNWVTGYK